MAGAPAVPWIGDARHSTMLAAMVWLLVVLMIVPDGFDYAGLTSLSAPTQGAPVTRLLWLSLLGLSAIFIAWRSALAWLVLRWLNPFLPAFLALAVASAAWSIEPSLTVRRDIRLLTFIGVALAFVLAGWHARRFQNVVRPILTLMLAGSVLFGLVFPLYAIHQESSPELAGAWRGLTNHKNSFGALSCIALIFWLHAGLSREVRPLAALAGGALAAACLLLSRSSTSLVTGLFATAFLVVFLRAPRGLLRYLPFATGAFVLLLLVYSVAILKLMPGLDLLLQPITLLTGKDLTFTKRSDIWVIISEHIDLHPLLGTGYGAYWTASTGSPSFEVVRRLYFYPASAHNGYLEIVNDLGIVGLFCLLGYLLTHLEQSLALLGRNRAQSALYLALFLQQALTNLSESHWLSPMSVNCVIMTLATAALARTRLEYRLRHYFGEPLACQTAPGAAAAAGG